MKMKKFLILDQDGEPIIETRKGEFKCGILPLLDYFIVKVCTKNYSFACAFYRDIKEAASAVDKLNKFADSVKKKNCGFLFPKTESSASISALEIVQLLDARIG